MALEARLDVADEAGRVAFTFSVVNGGTEPVTLRFDTPTAAEIAVYAGGDRVWEWYDERPGDDGATPLADQTLAPGDTVVHRATWDDPSAGEYTAEASVTARNVDRSARTQFTV